MRRSGIIGHMTVVKINAITRPAGRGSLVCWLTAFATAAEVSDE